MVGHYFKITFRQVRKHLLISILNISGLAIGIASFVLIMLYVNHELNYDRFNEHFDDIYRMAVNAQFANTSIQQTGTPAPMPRAMYDEYPEVKAIVSSGYSNDPIMANYKDYGFCGAIVKPYQMKDLVKIIKQVLG